MEEHNALRLKEDQRLLENEEPEVKIRNASFSWGFRV